MRPTVKGSTMKSRKQMLANLEHGTTNPKLPKQLQLKAKVLANQMKATDAKRENLEAKLKA